MTGGIAVSKILPVSDPPVRATSIDIFTATL